jgi:hypothetical protein
MLFALRASAFRFRENFEWSVPQGTASQPINRKHEWRLAELRVANEKDFPWLQILVDPLDGADAFRTSQISLRIRRR